MTFNESDHPRERGQFTDKTQSAPDTILQPAKPTATLMREVWVNDNAVQSGNDEQFPIDAILDTMSLDDLHAFAADPGNTDVTDNFYFEALNAGLVESHDGPFTVNADEGALADYVARRVAAGQTEPLSTTVPMSETRRREVVGQMLIRAYETVPTHWVMSGNSSSKTVRAEFQTAHDTMKAHLESTGIRIGDLDSRDQEVLASLRSVASGTDPRGGTVSAQAAYASAMLADWVITRSARFTELDRLRTQSAKRGE